MNSSLLAPFAFVTVAVPLVAACVGGRVAARPDIPAALRPPAGEAIQLEMQAAGSQVYECLPDERLPGGHAWRLRAPDAELRDRYGRPVGRHFAGPTWEALDGSAVTGEIVARDPGPNASAIPWLLVKATRNRGRGTFAATTSIQRVDTTGGKAPENECDATNLGQVARVPYRATYYFYGAHSPA